MKRSRVRSVAVSAVACAVVTAPGFFTPAFANETSSMKLAANADCSWSVGALPLPSGQTMASVVGGDGGKRVLGKLWKASSGPRGALLAGSVLWEDGQVARTAPTNQWWTDVNSSGVIAGGADNRPARIAADGRAEVLPVDASWTATWAEGINSRGDIVGWARTPLRNGTTADFVVVWPAGAPGTYRVLPRPFEGYASVAAGSTNIDDQGRVAASISAASSARRGYVWEQLGATPRQLEAPAGETEVVDIDNGRVLGNRLDSVQGAFVRVVTVWDAQGKIIRALPANLGSLAFTMNAEGLIGGRNYVSGQYFPTIWNADSQTSLPRDPAETPARYSYRWSVDTISAGGRVAAGSLAQHASEDGITTGYKAVIWRCL